MDKDNQKILLGVGAVVVLYYFYKKSKSTTTGLNTAAISPVSTQGTITTQVVPPPPPNQYNVPSAPGYAPNYNYPPITTSTKNTTAPTKRARNGYR